MKRLLVVLFLAVLLLIPAQVAQADAWPAADTDISHSVKLGTYYVQPGDTLWLIAQRYGTTVNSIQQLNNLPGTMTILERSDSGDSMAGEWRAARAPGSLIQPGGASSDQPGTDQGRVGAVGR